MAPLPTSRLLDAFERYHNSVTLLGRQVTPLALGISSHHKRNRISPLLGAAYRSGARLRPATTPAWQFIGGGFISGAATVIIPIFRLEGR